MANFNLKNKQLISSKKLSDYYLTNNELTVNLYSFGVGKKDYDALLKKLPHLFDKENLAPISLGTWLDLVYGGDFTKCYLSLCLDSFKSKQTQEQESGVKFDLAEAFLPFLNPNLAHEDETKTVEYIETVSDFCFSDLVKKLTINKNLNDFWTLIFSQYLIEHNVTSVRQFQSAMQNFKLESTINFDDDLTFESSHFFHHLKQLVLVFGNSFSQKQLIKNGEEKFINKVLFNSLEFEHSPSLLGANSLKSLTTFMYNELFNLDIEKLKSATLKLSLNNNKSTFAFLSNLSNVFDNKDLVETIVRCKNKLDAISDEISKKLIDEVGGYAYSDSLSLNFNLLEAETVNIDHGMIYEISSLIPKTLDFIKYKAHDGLINFILLSKIVNHKLNVSSLYQLQNDVKNGKASKSVLKQDEDLSSLLDFDYSEDTLTKIEAFLCFYKDFNREDCFKEIIRDYGLEKAFVIGGKNNENGVETKVVELTTYTALYHIISDILTSYTKDFSLIAVFDNDFQTIEDELCYKQNNTPLNVGMKLKQLIDNKDAEFIAEIQKLKTNEVVLSDEELNEIVDEMNEKILETNKPVNNLSNFEDDENLDSDSRSNLKLNHLKTKKKLLH